MARYPGVRRSMRRALLILVVPLLAACGLKDDLFLPEPEPAATAPTAPVGPAPAEEPEEDEAAPRRAP